MATKTIGASGKDYTTIAAWSAYVKAIGTLTEDETGQLTDDANYTRGAQTDLDFSGVTRGAYTITLEATTNKHDGDFGNGSRVEANVSFGGLYDMVAITIKDMSFRNTQTSNGGARVMVQGSATLQRVIGKTDSSGGNCDVFKATSAGHVNEACRAAGGTIGFHFGNADTVANACTAIGCGTGFNAGTANTATCKNNVAYNCTTDWAGTWSGTYSNNASEDATHPGTAGVTISGSPFDADGYTPATSGQLDGAGTNLGISLDAANNSFDATPSIGAYEDVGGGAAATGKSNPLNGPLGGPLAGGIGL